MRASPPEPPDRPELAPTRLRHGATHLFGRDDELAWLDRAWNDDAAHVASIVAWGGVGKTSLAAEWRNHLLADKHAPAWMFDWSFYSQGVRDSGAAHVDSFLHAALIHFGDAAMADSAASGWDKGARLAKLVGQRRAVLILDGLEPLQYSASAAVNPGGLKESAIEALLNGLAMHNRGLCVVTTRVKVAELERFGHTLAPRLDLDTLSPSAGADLLRSVTEPKHGKHVQSTQKEREDISREVQGHALTLQLVGVYLQQALGDIRKWGEIDFARANEEQGGHAFRVIDAYVSWLARAGFRGRQQLAVLRLLGLFDRPADPGCIAALRAQPAISGVTDALVGLDTHGWTVLTASLEELRLVTRGKYEAQPVWGFDEAAAETAWAGRPAEPPKQHRMPYPDPQAQVLDTHPLIREFFARDLRRTTEAGWSEGHRRLYEHLCRTVPHWPEGIEGLQPLYEAVVHGCAAGQIQDACNGIYYTRILRGATFYSRRQLGTISADLAAVACFFDHLWDTPSAALDEATQAWVLGEAAFGLSTLGRLGDALGPTRAGLEMLVRREDWNNAATAAGLQSSLELTLGRTSAAVEAAAQSVAYGDRSPDTNNPLVRLTVLADARHQAGDLAGARELFEQAETHFDPRDIQVFAFQFHHYFDLLLGPAEREAWRVAPGDTAQSNSCVTHCQEVLVRATRTLKLARLHHWVRDIALGHLTLGRAALFAATLLARTSTAPPPDLSLATARKHLDAVVDGLRNTNQLDHLPRALLARAWLLHRDHPDLARYDLDVAQTIADRGPMPLYQADIQLTRARLFRDRDALARARELITRHEYGRRYDELADAEQSALTWPAPVPPPSPATKSSAVVPLEIVPADAEYVFCRQGQNWTLRFRGCKAILMNNSKGLSYIRFLLARPDEQLTAFALEDLDDGREISLRPLATSFAVDNKTIKSVRQTMRELKADLIAAEEFCDTDEAARLRGDIEQLENYVKCEAGIGGTARRESPDQKRSRTAVSNAIGRAIAAIGKENDAFGKYLKKQIRTGFFLQYRDTTIRWVTL